MNLYNIGWKKFLSFILILGFFIIGFSSFAFAWEPKLPNKVHGPSSWYVNGKAGRYFVPVIQGKILSPTSGIVRTDSNCRPDSQGLSHCYNEIELLSGKIITIQNTHQMSKFHCLYPGEHVSVRPDGLSSWAIVQTNP